VKVTKFKRFFYELTEKEQERIRKAVSGKEMIRVKVVDSWIDDHLPCVGTTVNSIPLSFWWLSGEGSGALHFPNDPKAQKIIRSMIKAQIDIEDKILREEKLLLRRFNEKETIRGVLR